MQMRLLLPFCLSPKQGALRLLADLLGIFQSPEANKVNPGRFCGGVYRLSVPLRTHSLSVRVEL